jgi:hypothetical protein
MNRITNSVALFLIVGLASACNQGDTETSKAVDYPQTRAPGNNGPIDVNTFPATDEECSHFSLRIYEYPEDSHVAEWYGLAQYGYLPLETGQRICDRCIDAAGIVVVNEHRSSLLQTFRCELLGTGPSSACQSNDDCLNDLNCHFTQATGCGDNEGAIGTCGVGPSECCRDNLDCDDGIACNVDVCAAGVCTFSECSDDLIFEDEFEDP